MINSIIDQNESDVALLSDSPPTDSVIEIIKEGILDVFNQRIKDGELTVDEIDAQIQLLEDNGKLKELFQNMSEQMSSDSVDTIESIMYEKVLEERAYTDEFIARQNQKWGKAFAASEALYLCVLESTEHYEEHILQEHEGEENYLYFALKHLHARALQVYSEIICLIENGFADGAYARWRSLYELSVIAAFINKYGHQVAEAYVKSTGTNVKNEWARTAPCFSNRKKRDKITFKDLFDQSDINEIWEDEYKFTNLLVHGSADGTFHRLGTYGNTQVISVGRSDWGMSISAIHAAMSLVMITSEFFSVYTHGDSVVAVMTFNKWVSKITRFYEEVEKNCFPLNPNTLPPNTTIHGADDKD